MTAKKPTKKYTWRQYKSIAVGRALDRLRKHYKEQAQPDWLVIPYVLTCAAYLEAKLNDTLLQNADSEWGDDVTAALMSLSLPRKLLILVPLLTDGKYSIKKNHLVYERLASLIRVRNTIAHAKSVYLDIEATEDEVMKFTIDAKAYEVPTKIMDGEMDITLGASKTFTPLEYHEALDKLEMVLASPRRRSVQTRDGRGTTEEGWRQGQRLPWLIFPFHSLAP
jgi:hypothetical protein